MYNLLNLFQSIHMYVLNGHHNVYKTHVYITVCTYNILFYYSSSAESTTSFTNLLRPDPLRTRSDSNSSRPSSYHEPSMNLPPPGTTDYRRHIRGASNRTVRII